MNTHYPTNSAHTFTISYSKNVLLQRCLKLKHIYTCADKYEKGSDQKKSIILLKKYTVAALYGILIKIL